MKTLTLRVGALVLGILLVLVAILLGTLMGALAGWVVGLFFSETILGIFAVLGLKGFTLWQIGAFLGFTGSFVRSTLTTK